MKNKTIRILRIWYYGRIKLAKVIKKRIWIEIKTREFDYWNRVVREMRRSWPIYNHSEEVRKRVEAYRNSERNLDSYKKLFDK